MIRRLMVWLVSLTLAAPAILQSAPIPVYAQSNPDEINEPYNGMPLCLPDAYLQDPGNCLPLGPSAYLTDMARKGITDPPQPLPVIAPDPALQSMPSMYARINLEDNEQVPIYATLDDAVAKSNPVRFLPIGHFRYLAYVDVQRVNNKPYIQLASGEWVRAAPSGYSHFQGLIFLKTPAHSVGWIVETARPRRAPTYAAPETGQELRAETVVQIYDVQNQDKTDWYMIGMDEWVERRYVRQLEIQTTPPEGVDNNRWIDINLYEQTMAVYDNGQLVFATLIATGADPYYTRPGLFKIYQKKLTETMQGSFEADRSDFYYLENVPWTMYFDKARALHGAYWRAMWGYEQSHGCVNLSPGDAHWLYDWAKEGDYVYVHDPSGKTPTDPAFYGEGGA